MNCMNFDVAEHIIILTTLILIVIKNSRSFYFLSPLILIIQIFITFYFDIKSTKNKISCNTYEIPIIRKSIAICNK